MAKEYVYKNNKDNEYEINWDKMEFTVQKNHREFNTSDAEKVIDHEIYCDYYGEQIGYLHFSEYHNVIAKNIHPSLPKKQYTKLIYINNVLVNYEFRGWGIGRNIYIKFSEIYNNQFNGWPIAQVFVNPIAEYTFKKMIYEGYLPKESLIEDLIVRDYNKEEREKAKELFKWLPDHEQEKFKKKLKNMDKNKYSKLLNKVANILDLRNLNIEYYSQEYFKNGTIGTLYHSIEVSLADGQKVGSLNFFTHEKISERILKSEGDWNTFYDNIIAIDRLLIYPEFRNNCVALEMYKKFGEIYKNNFNDWIIYREFINPVAEYTFRKAISLGFVPESAFFENFIKREYDEEDKELARGLREKLPEKIKGPEQWASLNKIKFKRNTSSVLDFRNIK